MNRRSFLKASVTSIAALPLAAGFFSALSKVARAADADLPAIKEADAQAKAFNYCIDAKKAEKAKSPACPARKGKEHAGEFCSGCQLYTKVKGEGKAEMGKCLVIPGVLVYGGGWCNSYSKKMS